MSINKEIFKEKIAIKKNSVIKLINRLTLNFISVKSLLFFIMVQDTMKIKHCCDCNLPIPFAHFMAMHPFLSKLDAKELYENPLIGVYCPNCYFQRPEKPYKKRRRYTYYNWNI